MDIKEVNNYRKLGKLFKDSGIEVKTFDDLPEGVIAAYEGYIDNEFVGGVSIQKKNGEYLIYDIAVMKELRGKHIGRALLLHALNKINEFEATRVYLVAKAPKFFEKYGFCYVPDSEVPPLFNCLNCEQYNVTCFPKVMRLNMKNCRLFWNWGIINAK